MFKVVLSFFDVISIAHAQRGVISPEYQPPDPKQGPIIKVKFGLQLRYQRVNDEARVGIPRGYLVLCLLRMTGADHAGREQSAKLRVDGAEYILILWQEYTKGKNSLMCSLAASCLRSIYLS